MGSLYMIEIRPDIEALLRFLHGQGLLQGHSDEDLGYGVHAWLSAAFGTKAPKPWRLFHDRRRPTRILSYSNVHGEELATHMAEFAEPAVAAVCREPQKTIASKVMPTWQSGRRLGFEIVCCPVGRKAKTGIEKDIFLIAADAAGDNKLDRGHVYSDWAKERLEQNRAATVGEIHLAGFRLVRQLRQTDDQKGSRRHRQLTRPWAMLRGELVVGDSVAFGDLLAKGIGRHRSFGYGMILLRPIT